MQKGSAWLNSKSAPAEKDIEFSSVTKSGTRRIHQLSTGVAHVSSKTIGYIANLAEAAGGKVAGHSKKSKDDNAYVPYFYVAASTLTQMTDSLDTYLNPHTQSCQSWTHSIKAARKSLEQQAIAWVQ